MRIIPTGFAKFSELQPLISEEDKIATDAWIDAIPEDPYAPCPCGCGKKWRFVMRGGNDEEINAHYQRFKENLLKNP